MHTTDALNICQLISSISDNKTTSHIYTIQNSTYLHIVIMTDRERKILQKRWEEQANRAEKGEYICVCVCV